MIKYCAGIVTGLLMSIIVDGWVDIKDLSPYLIDAVMGVIITWFLFILLVTAVALLAKPTSLSADRFDDKIAR